MTLRHAKGYACHPLAAVVPIAGLIGTTAYDAPRRSHASHISPGDPNGDGADYRTRLQHTGLHPDLTS